MLESLRQKVAESMKARTPARTSILRVLMGELQKAGIESDGPEAHKVVRKLVEGNNEAIELLDGERREALVEENKVLQEFLPAYLSQEQIRLALEPVQQQIRNAKSDGQATGVAMRHLFGRYVEGGTVKQVVEEIRKPV